MSTPVIKEVSFVFPLRASERPLSGRVANAALFGELVPGGGVLVYGCYDLVLCYNSFWAEVLPRAFALQVQLSSAAKKGELRVSWSRPFEVVFRPSGPPRARPWELLKRLIWGRPCFEAVVAGEVAVEVIAADEPSPVAGRAEEGQAAVDGQRKSAADSAEDALGWERKKTARRRGDEVTIELEALADLVAHLLDKRRQEATISQKQFGLEAGRPLPQEAWPGRSALERLEEIVRRVVREYEEEKRGGSGDAEALTSLPLEQIPSRPGLFQGFPQNIPPPKPHPGPTGGEGVKPTSWSDVCSLLRNIPLHPPSKPSGPQERGGSEQS